MHTLLAIVRVPILSLASFKIKNIIATLHLFLNSKLFIYLFFFIFVRIYLELLILFIKVLLDRYYIAAVAIQNITAEVVAI